MGKKFPRKGNRGVTNTHTHPTPLLRLEGPHHHYSDPTRATKPNHHTEPHGPRISPIRGAHLPGAAFQLTGESAQEDGGDRF